MKPTPNRIRLTAAALALTTLACAPTASAAIPVEALEAGAPAAAHDKTAMWSRLDAKTGKYQLVQSLDGGAPTLVAVPQRKGAFDVDLGSNLRGATYAVYTRGGDIYRLDPRTAVETKLTQLSSPVLAERNPTIEDGQIAFLRRDGGMDQLRIGQTNSRGIGSRLLLKRDAIQSIELGSKHVAYVDRIRTLAPSTRHRVHILGIASRKDRVVYQAGSGGASHSVVSKPSFDSDESGFLWTRSRIGAAGSRIVKYALSTGKLSYAQGSPRYASVAWAGDKLGVIFSTSIDALPAGSRGCIDGGVRYCVIGYTGPLSFGLKP